MKRFHATNDRHDPKGAICMDPNRIDDLARVVGSGQSRRRILKTLAGGAFGALAASVGIGDASAAKKRSAGNVCATNADCLSNHCLSQGRGRAICACGSPTECPQATDQCHIATCIVGICGIGVNTGAACNDGDLCTTGETCQANGTCGGGTATVCTASDACHDAGTCDPGTGVCSNPAKTNGVSCGAGLICQSGVCVVSAGCGGACGTGGQLLDGTCFLAYPNCPGSYGVAANGCGVNPCICGSGSLAVCGSSGECASGEVCILIGSTGQCFGGCSA
jgi:hypothetical protein